VQPFAQFRTGTIAHETRQDLHRLPALPDVASLRLPGGAATLYTKLAGQLPAGTLQLYTRVTHLCQLSGSAGVEVVAKHDGQWQRYVGAVLVLALPPRLLAARLAFGPAHRPAADAAHGAHLNELRYENCCGLPGAVLARAG
jgi:monoamine oxidase